MMQNLSVDNQPPVRRSPRGKGQPDYKTSQQTPSRPSIGPIYHDQELNQMLPPKRDLPFIRPKSKISRADTSSLKSSQQIVPESSYPEPTIKRQESFMSESQSQPLIQTQPYPEATEQAMYFPQIQATLPYPGSSTQTQQPIPEPSVAGSIGSSQLNRHSNAQDVQEPQSAATTIRNSVEGQLSQYVKSPTAERTAFLENWMCKLIEDDNFVTLCEDVEGTWRRFAFGLKRSCEVIDPDSLA